MYRYKVDETKFYLALKKAGFRSLSDFAQRNPVNRMTLFHYFKGQGPFSESYYTICASLGLDPLSLLSQVSAGIPCEFVDEILPIAELATKDNKQLAVMIIGSRAKGTSKQYSDWDLGLTTGSAPLTTHDYFRIKRVLTEAADDLPRSLDVVNLDQAPHWFLEKMDYTPIFLSGNRSAHDFFLGVLHGSQKKC
ncbi:MAG: hypothetical protein ACD_62C00043G0004 [uncultured bacterium]|nr:MAG: hypothetical protein ACD_62C00043G0004 [uncultured bacterium]HLD44848.1 nucleotidyltransferase domain-containing protein [bacterium]